MTATSKATEQVQAPGSLVLASWLASREGGAQRAGLVPAISNDVSPILSSDPRIVELFGSSLAASGMAVTATSAQRVAAVYGCVTRIAGGISTMPINIYERIWDEKAQRYARRQVDNKELWWMLNERPTARYTAASHWESVASSFLLRGDGFTVMQRKNSGAISEMVPMDWRAVTPKKRDNGRLMYTLMDGYNARGLDQDDVLHFPGFGFDGERSASVISFAAHSAVGNALAMDQYTGKFFGAGAHHNMVLETDKKMDPDKVTALQRMFAEKYSGLDNAHNKPLVLTEGMTAKPVTISAEDAQLIDARRYTKLDICTAFGVPPHMIGETSAATTWGSGLEQIGRAFVTYTLAPHLKRIEDELNFKLFRTARFFCEFDRNALQAGDSKAQSDEDKASLGGPGAGPGWVSVNEVRRRRNMPPLEGDQYNKPFVPDTKATAAPAANPGANP